MLAGTRMEFDPLYITAEAPAPPAKTDPDTWDYVGAVLDALKPTPAAAAGAPPKATVVVRDRPFPWLAAGLVAVGTSALVFLATRKRRRNPARRRRRPRGRQRRRR